MSSVEQVDAFCRFVLRGHQEKPLLTVSRTDGGPPMVSGAWEDHLGARAAVIKENRLVWASSPAFRLEVRDTSVALVSHGDEIWRIALAGESLSLEGIFFTVHGMIVISGWGFMGWPPDELGRVLNAALAEWDGPHESRPVH